MRRGSKILVALALALAVLLALNAVVTDRDTEPAEVTVSGAEILQLPGGDLQVLDRGPRSGSPIVLVHCFTCAIEWWDRLTPRLERRHRVIAIDLLGHGGSEKPSSGYEIPEQADRVAEALARLRVRRATVVGHSLGGTVATALAERSPALVERVVIIDQAPDESYGEGLGLLAQATFVPVLGEALWRVKTDSSVEQGLEEAFAPGYDVPDEFVEALRRMTYTAYDEAVAREDDYSDEEPLDRRLARAGVPLLAIFGAKEKLYDSPAALAAYEKVAGAETALIPGAGHSPNVETPAQTATLILDFVQEPLQKRGAVRGAP